jgi:hypothetical protein
VHGLLNSDATPGAPCSTSVILDAVLAALILLVLTVLLYRRFVSGYVPAPLGLAVLSGGEAAFIDAVAEVLFPGGLDLPLAGIDARLPHYVDRHLAALPRAQRWQIRALFILVENLTLVMPGDEPGGRRRFSSLTAASRVSILEKLAGHPKPVVRMLFIALRVVLVLGYLGHPANSQGLGVAPFEIEFAVSDAELLFPRIGALVSSIRYQPEDRTTSRPRPPLDPHGPRHRAYARSSREPR